MTDEWSLIVSPKIRLYDEFVTSFLTEKKCIKCQHQRIAVFVYLQRKKTNNSEANPYEFDTFNINAYRAMAA